MRIVLILLPFISSASNTECLKLRENISQCSDTTLFRRLETRSTRTALASLPGTYFKGKIMVNFVCLSRPPENCKVHFCSLMLTGSGTNWVAHLIELATGIRTSKNPLVLSDGTYIATLDHFLDNHFIEIDKTSRGIQIGIPQHKTFKVDIRLFHQHQ